MIPGMKLRPVQDLSTYVPTPRYIFYPGTFSQGRSFCSRIQRHRSCHMSRHNFSWTDVIVKISRSVSLIKHNNTLFCILFGEPISGRRMNISTDLDSYRKSPGGYPHPPTPTPRIFKNGGDIGEKTDRGSHFVSFSSGQPAFLRFKKILWQMLPLINPKVFVLY